MKRFAWFYIANLLVCLLVGCSEVSESLDSESETALGDMEVDESKRSAALLEDIDSATEHLQSLLFETIDDNGEPAQDGYFRGHYHRYNLFAMVLSGGLEGFIVTDSTGVCLEETIAACNDVGADGWAEMLRRMKEVLFGEKFVSEEVYYSWLDDNPTLKDSAKQSIRQIESEFFDATPSLCENMYWIQLNAAIDADIPGVKGMISDKELFEEWIRQEKGRFNGASE